MIFLFVLILNSHAAPPKAKVYPMSCSFVRSQLIDVAYDDADSFDTYNMVDQGVFTYMCAPENGTTDKTETLCAHAKRLKCKGL